MPYVLGMLKLKKRSKEQHITHVDILPYVVLVFSWPMMGIYDGYVCHFITSILFYLN